ncbi:MAG: CPBP family intramembrane metalloprotease [Anaerolineales bacterium]|nr:CPBP family intramembrane metalloprotease [Anaerolineales bacterium]
MNQLPSDEKKPAAWSGNDAWLGLGLMLIVSVVYFAIIFSLKNQENILVYYVASFEFTLLIPIAVIFFWRKVSWKELGFQKFSGVYANLALGFGLLIGAYILVIVNNIAMIALGVVTQADVLSEMIGEVNAPYLFAFTTVIVAPIVEEMFFRGFLFKGLREKYGWIHALFFSSLIFAIFHGQIATLIPTFLLGALFSYMYQRTESIYPGIILHFFVNALGSAALLLM